MASIDLTNEETINVSLSEPEKINAGVKNVAPINVESSDGWYEKKYEEIDPIFSSSVASTITNDDIERWNSGKDIPENLSEFVDDLGDNPVHTHHQYLTEHQDISTKQDILVSGTNIKTINNQSLLGSGNITIQGGGSGGGDMYKSTYDTNNDGIVDKATADKDGNQIDTTYAKNTSLPTFAHSSEYYKTSITVGENNYEFMDYDRVLRVFQNNEDEHDEFYLGLSNKVDKVTGKGLSSNDYTTEEKTKLASIDSGAEENVIESISVNGTAQSITNKNVDIAVPIRLSELIDDLGSSPVHTHSQYLTSYTETDPTVPSHVKNITTTDISTWNNKSDFSGDYDDLTNTPTNVSEFTNDAGYLTSHQDISGKVDKETGKGLSTNDFTNAYKNNVDSNTSARHTHSNKSVLDGIVSTDITNWNSKQPALVSGSNIKTINGNSVLGNGDITVEEGASLVKYIVTDSMTQSELNEVGQEILDAYNDGKSYGRDYVVYLDTAYYHGTCPGFILLAGFLKFYSGAYFTSPRTQQDYSRQQRLSRYILQVDVSSATTMIIDDLIGKSSYLCTDPDEYYSDINYYTPTYKSQPVSKGYLNDRENKLLTAFGLDTDTYDETSTYSV